MNYKIMIVLVTFFSFNCCAMQDEPGPGEFEGMSHEELLQFLPIFRPTLTEAQREKLNEMELSEVAKGCLTTKENFEPRSMTFSGEKRDENDNITSFCFTLAPDGTITEEVIEEKE